MKFNKLVRDNIPNIIERGRKKAIIHIADDEEYGEKLKEKLLEEAKEFFIEENEEEFADILEVIDEIYNFKKFDKDKIQGIKDKKKKDRGGFDKRIILDEIKD